MGRGLRRLKSYVHVTMTMMSVSVCTMNGQLCLCLLLKTVFNIMHNCNSDVCWCVHCEWSIVFVSLLKTVFNIIHNYDRDVC